MDRGDHFKPGTTLEKVWRRYAFDRQLRLVVLDAIERIEVSLKTALAYHMAHKHGVFSYLEYAYVPNLKADVHARFVKRMQDEQRRSSERFSDHFRRKYGDCHSALPIWMAAEVMSFGGMLTLYRGVEAKLKQEIALRYKVADSVLLSWIRSINGIRNLCAHHARLWNRELGDKPKIPRGRKHSEWHIPVQVSNNRIFGLLTILKYMMGTVAPNSRWPKRLQELMHRYQDVPQRFMGFPENWEECPIWKETV